MPTNIKLGIKDQCEGHFRCLDPQNDLRIYNIFTRYFYGPSEWLNVTKFAKSMGFNAIYLNPINKTGSSESLYSIADYFDWDARVMGNVSKEEGKKELKKYLDECKKLGMKVFYDLVVNHTAYDSELVKQHDEWYEHDEDGNVSHGSCNTGNGTVIWEDSAKLDYDISNVELYDYIESICDFYLKLGFSGFRCDAAAYLPSVLWKNLIKKVHKKYPEAMFLGEAFMVPLENIDALAEAGFDYAFSSAKWWNGYDSWFPEQTKRFQNHGLKLISFPDNHDTERLMFEVNGNVSLLRQRLMFIGISTSSFEISNGFEFGFVNKPHVVETTPSDIENTSFNFVPEIEQAISLRNQYEIFRTEGNIYNIWPANREIVFIEKDPLDEEVREKALIIMNRTDKTIHISNSRLNELFVGDCVYKSDSTLNDNELEPYGIHIFVSKQEIPACVSKNQSYCLVKKQQMLLKELPIKNLFSDEALVEIEACGICGSDRREFSGGRFFWSSEETGGHEFVGRVLQVGKNCSKVKVGDIVANCISRDREGVTQFGGYSQYAVVRENCLFVLPSDVNRIQATLIEPMACAVHIGKMIQNNGEKKIAIVGSGTIALFTEQYLRYQNPNQQIDFLYKHDNICKYVSPETRCIEFRNVFSHGMFDYPNQYDVVMECSGNAKIFGKLFELLSDEGTIILSGIYNDSLVGKGNNISLSTMMFHETKVQGSFLYTPEDFAESANLILNNYIKVRDIITLMEFKDIQEAFEIPSSDRVKIVLYSKKA